MGSRALIRSTTLPYHVVNQVNNRDGFQLPMDKVWEIFSYALFEINLLFQAQIHAFVLMNNHYHLIISTPEADLGVVMQNFSANVAKSFNFHSGREGHLFKGRYKWTLIDNCLYEFHATKYVYRNPIRAGICERVDDYTYSSLRGLLGLDPVRFPIAPLPFQSMTSDLAIDWLSTLNRPSRKEHEAAIRLGLRRPRFALPRMRKGIQRVPSELETEQS